MRGLLTVRLQPGARASARPGVAARVRRLVVAGLLVFLAVVGWAAPAAAHTALAASTPGHRSSVPGSPATMRLVFTEPVDLALVSVTLRGIEGGLQPEPQLLPSDTVTGTVVDFTLPAMENDTYGATWQSVGPDGHRATGEILFAVGGGVVDGAEALVGSGVSTGDRALDTAALIGRAFWYLTLALAAGALFAAYHLRRAQPDPSPAHRRPRPAPDGTNAAPADRTPALVGATPSASSAPSRGASTLNAATTSTTNAGPPLAGANGGGTTTAERAVATEDRPRADGGAGKGTGNGRGRGQAKGASLAAQRAGLAEAAAAAAWLARLACGLAAVAALVRGGVAVGTLLAAGAGGSAFTGRAAIGWAAAAGACAVAFALLPRRTAQPSGKAADRTVAAAVALLLALVASVLAGHALSRADAVTAAALGWVHGVAAVVWVGVPLAWTVLHRRARRLGAGQQHSTGPSVATRAVFGAFGPFAIGSAVALGVTALPLLDSRGGATGQGLGVLIAKTALAGVALLLGFGHHRVLASRAARQRGGDPPAAGLLRTVWERHRRTLPLEAAVLASVVVLGSLLVSIDQPAQAPGGTLPASAVGATNVTDVSVCATLPVGSATCYRDYLAGLLDATGAGPALAELERLNTSDGYITEHCHQVAHDLGADALAYYGSIGGALQTSAGTCWSGYTHGVMETALAGFDDEELRAEVPAICEDAAEVRYSFVHYNCLHGLGHGVMLRYDADLFATEPVCRLLGEYWEQRSCMSGAFMENIVAAQEGREDPPALDEENLLYPCTDVATEWVEDCYLMQTSYVMWQLNYDIEQSFTWCDRAGDYISTCYRSMGRDISGLAVLDAQKVVDWCGLGRAEYETWCIDGAASNAVFDQGGDTGAADALCAAVAEDLRQACVDRVAEAAANVASSA